jgi:hypothetical protein
MENNTIIGIILCIIVLVISICIVLCFVFPTKQTEGNSGMNDIFGDPKSDDPCSYELDVPGRIEHIPKPSAHIDIPGVMSVDVLEPIHPIIDCINDIIDVINDTIIFGHYIAFDFINCLMFYLLDAFGKIIYGIILGFFKLIRMGDLPEMVYDFFDKVDAKLYEMSGNHFMHFPTKIQNKCYHIFGKDRIPCWKNPYATKGNRQEGIGIANDEKSNSSFYELLIKSIFVVFTLCLFYVLAIFVARYFFFKPNCPSGTCLQ